MQSTLSLTGQSPAINNSSSLANHRARLSIHFATPHMRRWLLVQLVSIPVEQAEEEPEVVSARKLKSDKGSRDGLRKAVDRYNNDLWLKRYV